jgi:hypothetical protein
MFSADKPFLIVLFTSYSNQSHSSLKTHSKLFNFAFSVHLIKHFKF